MIKMTDKKELLQKRAEMLKKKPRFIKKDVHRKAKLKIRWRKPKGLQNKQRIKGKSHMANPDSGYRSPAEIRGVHKSGLIPVVISNILDLEKVSKSEGVIISSKLGDKKRLLIIEKIKSAGLRVLNLDVEKAVEKINLKQKSRKQSRSDKLKIKKEKKSDENKKKKTKAKASSQEEQKPELTAEEKKKAEKKELDKVLTKKE